MFQILRVWSPTHLADFLSRLGLGKSHDVDSVKAKPKAEPKAEPKPSATQVEASALVHEIQDTVSMSGDKVALSKQDAALLKSLARKSQDPQYVPSQEDLQALRAIAMAMGGQLKGPAPFALPSDAGKHLGMAKDPKTSSEALRALAKSEDETVRFQVAKHKDTPPDVLRDLAQDPNFAVQATAAQRLG